MATIIRQATIKDKTALWDFIKTAYEEDDKEIVPFKIPDRWIWQFTENPFIKEPKNKLPIWVAIKDNQIVGQQCSQPFELIVRNKIINASWSCDTITLESCRGEGIASRLKKAYFDHYPVSIAIGMAPIVRTIWKKAGGIEINPVYNYFYPVYADKKYIYKYLSKRTIRKPKINKFVMFSCNYFFLHNFLSLACNTVIKIRSLIKIRHAPRADLNIEEINKFDRSIDAFFNDIRKDYTIVARRNSKFLNWRFFKNMQMEYHAFTAKSGTSIKGYMVLRKPHPAEIGIGVIVDFFAGRDDSMTIAKLLQYAINYLGNSVTGIKCTSSVYEYRDIFHKLGFIELPPLNPIIICSPTLKDELKSKTYSWFLTAADQDIDQIIPF